MNKDRYTNDIESSDINKQTYPDGEIRSDRDNTRSKVAEELFRLSNLEDYKVASSDPDVRGWDLLDRDRNKIGTIEELIVDPKKQKARYLDVVAFQGLSKEGKAENRHFILPIGIARIDDQETKVKVNDLNAQSLMDLPEYDGGEITRDYETRLVEKLRGNSEPLSNDGDFYSDRFYDDEKFYNAEKK